MELLPILNEILIVESLKTAKEFAQTNNISQDVFDKFNQIDTTPTKKFIHQLLKWYQSDNSLVDKLEDLIKFLHVFVKFTDKIKQPIEKFKTYDEFVQMITPFADLKSNTDKKDELKGQYLKIFENDKLAVVWPLTHKASCIYGSNTKWCTTMKTAEHFNRYMADGYTIYYVLSKLVTVASNPFHKVAVVVGQAGGVSQCFDNRDEDVGRTRAFAWFKDCGMSDGDLKKVFKKQEVPIETKAQSLLFNLKPNETAKTISYFDTSDVHGKDSVKIISFILDKLEGYKAKNIIIHSINLNNVKFDSIDTLSLSGTLSGKLASKVKHLLLIDVKGNFEIHQANTITLQSPSPSVAEKIITQFKNKVLFVGTCSELESILKKVNVGNLTVRLTDLGYGSQALKDHLKTVINNNVENFDKLTFSLENDYYGTIKQMVDELKPTLRTKIVTKR